jgi:hypothetical protein
MATYISKGREYELSPAEQTYILELCDSQERAVWPEGMGPEDFVDDRHTFLADHSARQTVAALGDDQSSHFADARVIYTDPKDEVLCRLLHAVGHVAVEKGMDPKRVAEMMRGLADTAADSSQSLRELLEEVTRPNDPVRGDRPGR